MVIVVVVVVVLRNCCCRFKTTEMKSEVVRSEAAKFNFGFVVVVVVFLQRKLLVAVAERLLFGVVVVAIRSAESTKVSNCGFEHCLFVC